jgi:hypothetical protein
MKIYHNLSADIANILCAPFLKLHNTGENRDVYIEEERI